MKTYSKLSLLFITGVFISNPSLAASDIKAEVREAKPGKTFESILTEAGFTKSEAYQLLLKKVIPFKMHLNPHEKYLIVHIPEKNRFESRFYLDYSDDALVFWKEGKQIGVSRDLIPFKVIKKTFAGSVHGSLIESIKSLISDEWPAFRFMDAFSWDLNLGKKLKRNDTYKFSIEEKYDLGRFVKYGEIVDAELKTQGNVLRRLLWQNEKTKVFVDPIERFEDRPFYAPVDYVHISSPFSRRRFHPVRHNYQPHLGVDFALDAGSPIYAPRDGVIAEVDFHHANGNFIIIKHDGQLQTCYNHLSRFADSLKVGKQVKAGEIIGYVGCTGYCTSPHLDFRIRRGNYLYDPMYLTKPFPFKERNYWTSTRFKELLGALTSMNDPLQQKLNKSYAE